jgi:hypothetical protein
MLGPAIKAFELRNVGGACRRLFPIHARFKSFEVGGSEGMVSKLPRSSSTLSCIRDCNWRANAIASISESEAAACSHSLRTRSSKVMKRHARRRRTLTQCQMPYI